MNNFFVGAIHSILFLDLLLLLEYITRKNHYPKEYTRKIAHVLSGLFAASMGFVLEPNLFIIFAVAFLVIISLSYGVNFFSSIHNVKRKTYGELLFPVGICIAYIFSSGNTLVYLASVLILTVSDTLAGIAGNISQRKSTYGSTLFFVSAFVILLFFFNMNQIVLLASIALVITGVERISSFGTDNVTIPIVSVFLLRFLLQV